MQSQSASPGSGKPRWAIVLSGGEGERLRQVTERWLGAHRPKQYCTFLGTRTMLEHTLDRAVASVGPDRVVTVIGRGHRTFVKAAGLPGKVIEQPINLDTATGIFLGLAYVEAMCPEATVAIFPSDHFITPENRFLEHVKRAMLLAERLPERLILLGAYSDRPETEFGWVEPGPPALSWSWSSRHMAHEVMSFREKPCENEALDFFSRGFLWNTMIMAAQAAMLREAGETYLPELLRRLRTVREFWTSTSADPVGYAEQEALTLLEIYRGLPRANFSHDILQLCPNRAVVLPMADVEWSDWGKPERISETLQRYPHSSSVPREYLTAG